MNRLQRIVSFVALGAVAVAIIYASLPFTFADTVSCGPALFGSEPRSAEPAVGLIQPDIACERTGRSRLATSGFVAILAVVTGAGVTQVKEPGKDCKDGRHADCHGGWPALIGLNRFACQCSCHPTS